MSADDAESLPGEIPDQPGLYTHLCPILLVEWRRHRLHATIRWTSVRQAAQTEGVLDCEQQRVVVDRDIIFDAARPVVSDHERREGPPAGEMLVGPSIVLKSFSSQVMTMTLAPSFDVFDPYGRQGGRWRS